MVFFVSRLEGNEMNDTCFRLVVVPCLYLLSHITLEDRPLSCITGMCCLTIVRAGVFLESISRPPMEYSKMSCLMGEYSAELVACNLSPLMNSLGAIDGVVKIE